jgi:hypothetical protein
VSRPPFIPAHSSAALEAKAHALIERAAAFAAAGASPRFTSPHSRARAVADGVQPF